MCSLSAVASTKCNPDDSWFHFRPDERTGVYGLLEGIWGNKASQFCRERLPAELLLGQLEGKQDESQLKELLLQAFATVDKAYLHSLDPLLLQRATLQLQDGSHASGDVALVGQLSELESQIATGCCVAVALVLEKRLFVANAGRVRALLVRRRSAMGPPLVEPLSVEHGVSNEDELLRLAQLGLSPEALKNSALPCTRCLGAHTLKAPEHPLLRGARGEAVTAEPEVVGEVSLDDGCRFLLLVTNSVCQNLEDAGFQNNWQQELARMAEQELDTQKTLAEGVQAVLGRVAAMHPDGQPRPMTLLVRKFVQSPRTEPAEGSSSIKVPRPLFNPKRPPVAGQVAPYIDFSPFFALAQEAVLKGTWPSQLEL